MFPASNQPSPGSSGLADTMKAMWNTAAYAAAVERAAKAEAEAAARRKRYFDDLQRQYGAAAASVEKLAQRNARLTGAVRDGTYVRQAREIQRLNREYEKTRREVDLIARYGERAGRFLSRYGGALAVGGRLAGAGVMAGTAVGASMVHRGFSGTVEGNRAELELTLASRELAGSFKPLIDLSTKLTRRFREWLEKRSPGEQDAIMVGGTAAAGGLALRAIVGGGVMGAIGSRLLGGGAAAGAGAAGAGAAGGAAVAGGAAAAAGGAAGVGAAATGVGLLARSRRLLTKVAIPLALAETAYEATTGGFYSELRKRGENKFVSGLGAAGGGFMDLLSLGSYGEAFRKKHPSEDAAGPNKERRQVTKADAGFDEIGSSYYRLSNAIALTDASRLASEGGGGATGGTGVGGALENITAALMGKLDEVVKAIQAQQSPELLRPGGT